MAEDGEDRLTSQYGAEMRIPWPITVVSVLVATGCGMIAVIWRDFPREKLSEPFNVSTMFLHGAPLILVFAVSAGLLAWLIERRLRKHRNG